VPIRQVVELIGQILALHISSGVFRKRTGKVVITVNIRDGGIGSVGVATEQSLTEQDLRTDDREQ
jgi:hypothetical protein